MSLKLLNLKLLLSCYLCHEGVKVTHRKELVSEVSSSSSLSSVFSSSSFSSFLFLFPTSSSSASSCAGTAEQTSRWIYNTFTTTSADWAEMFRLGALSRFMEELVPEEVQLPSARKKVTITLEVSTLFHTFYGLSGVITADVKDRHDVTGRNRRSEVSCSWKHYTSHHARRALSGSPLEPHLTWHADGGGKLAEISTKNKKKTGIWAADFKIKSNRTSFKKKRGRGIKNTWTNNLKI